LRKNVANYLQHTTADEGYLVSKNVKTGKQQIIALPPLADATGTPDADNQKIIQEEAIRAGRQNLTMRSRRD
jgi:hypothetical protein